MSITVERAAGALGAFVTGVDLTRPVSNEQMEDLWAALDQHMVIFLPDQPMGLDALERFTDELGGRDMTPFVKPLPERPYVIKVLREPTDELNFANAWHTDLSYLPEPPAYTVLHAWEVPTAGGDTLWANQNLAFETLSEGLQETLLPLKAVHSARETYGVGGYLDKVKGKSSMEIEPSPSAAVEHTHPVVAAHPRTGAPSLYVNPVYTTRFDGWSRTDSRDLLSFLWRHQVSENFTCRLRWRQGMVAIWDNRCTLHNALDDYRNQRREMYRTSVKGARVHSFRD